MPAPVNADRLYLSSQGAWLDLHGSWDVEPYAKQSLPTLESWDHIAPMGRDQYVKLVYPGYLFPFGHRASLIKLTERRIDDAAQPVADPVPAVLPDRARAGADLRRPDDAVRAGPVAARSSRPTSATPARRAPRTRCRPTSSSGRPSAPRNSSSPSTASTTTAGASSSRRRCCSSATRWARRPPPANSSATPTPSPTPGRRPRDPRRRAERRDGQEHPRRRYRPSRPTRCASPAIPACPVTCHSAPHLVSATIVVPAMKKLAPQSPSGRRALRHALSRRRLRRRQRAGPGVPGARHDDADLLRVVVRRVHREVRRLPPTRPARPRACPAHSAPSVRSTVSSRRRPASNPSNRSISSTACCPSCSGCSRSSTSSRPSASTARRSS